MWRFQDAHGRLPGLHSAADAAAVVVIAKAIAEECKVANTAAGNTAMYIFRLDRIAPGRITQHHIESHSITRLIFVCA
jgi:hypothetical protein